MWIIGLLLVLLLAGAAFYLYKQKQEEQVSTSSSDRYAAQETISPAHAKLLLYLQHAFGGQAVLFRPRLAQLVSLRSAGDREKTLAMLERLSVDFVVCDDNGKPQYAFDVRPRNADAEDAKTRRINQTKTRILKSIDVKLIRIQRSVSQMPPINEFASRLRQSLDGIPAGAVPHSGFHTEPPAPPPPAQPTDMAPLTEIMSLPPDTEVVAPPPPRRH